MKKKQIPRLQNRSELQTQKVVTALKSETAHFVIGLLCVIFGVYMLLAFSSFFFTGGNDQSILAHPNPGELLETGNRIQNYAGTRGAQLSQYLINDCFGIPAYCIIVFLIVAGMKLMKAYNFSLRKWFAGLHDRHDLVLHHSGTDFRRSFCKNSFIYPGGLHGYKCQPLVLFPDRNTGTDSGPAGNSHSFLCGTDQQDNAFRTQGTPSEPPQKR